jgi:hypothetical protein
MKVQLLLRRVGAHDLVAPPEEATRRLLVLLDHHGWETPAGQPIEQGVDLRAVPVDHDATVDFRKRRGQPLVDAGEEGGLTELVRNP